MQQSMGSHGSTTQNGGGGGFMVIRDARPGHTLTKWRNNNPCSLSPKTLQMNPRLYLPIHTVLTMYIAVLWTDQGGMSFYHHHFDLVVLGFTIRQPL